MNKTHRFAGPTRDYVITERIEDKDHGPVLWLQTSNNGCYIPVDRLAEFIDGLKATAAAETADDNAA
jgi:hypothetical protein